MDISFKFETMSIHGNWYRMAIIDVMSKYVWNLKIKYILRYKNG
jgi:hypothetical protein